MARAITATSPLVGPSGWKPYSSSQRSCSSSSVGPFDDDWVEQCLAAAIEELAVHAGRGLYRNEIRAIAAELRDTTPTETNGKA